MKNCEKIYDFYDNHVYIENKNMTPSDLKIIILKLELNSLNPIFSLAITIGT